MDVRLTLGEVGRWGRAVLDHGGDPVGRSAAGGWLRNLQKLVRELAPGRERVDNWGRSGGTGDRGWTHPVVVVVVVSLFDLGLLLRIDRIGFGERQRRRRRSARDGGRKRRRESRQERRRRCR